MAAPEDEEDEDNETDETEMMRDQTARGSDKRSDRMLYVQKFCMKIRLRLKLIRRMRHDVEDDESNVEDAEKEGEAHKDEKDKSKAEDKE